MIKKEELIKAQKDTGLLLSTIEKDYVLSLLIWAIVQNPNLGNNWVFKGGTCIKKCYFGNYRFSEDLDYTILPHAPVDEAHIKEELLVCFDLLFENFGLKIDTDNLEIMPFPDKNDQFIQVKIPFRGPLMPSGSWPRIKLDLSREEKVVDKPAFLPLNHHYSDDSNCATTVMCYSLYEIFAEKMRALVQRTRPRDLYDVVHLAELFESKKLDKDRLHNIAVKKFDLKGLKYPDSLQEISSEAMAEAKADWETMLSHQVPNLQDMSIYINKFNLLLKYWGQDRS